MSEITKSYFDNAQLAQAAYAFLNKDLLKEDFIGKLEGDEANFSESQATQFASQYSVVHDQQNTADGFSATLFKGTAGTYTLAIRGTEPPPSLDVINDLLLTDFGDIGGDGIALKQAVDLFNYYQKLITPSTGVNNQAMQLEFYEGTIVPEAGVPFQDLGYTNSQNNPQKIYRYLKVVDSVEGLGEIPPDAKINVTGHSLGGHLALILSRLDPAHINEVYTYNAPGFDIGGIAGSQDAEWFFDTIDTIQLQELGSSAVQENGFPDAKLNNIVIPLDLVSDIGTIPNGQISIFGEDSAPSYLAAHDKAGLTDVLAIYNLLSDLSSGQSLEQFTSLFEQGSNQSEGDIEGILNGLGDIIGVDGTDVTAGDREQFYQRIKTISDKIYVDSSSISPQLKPEYQGLNIVAVNRLSASADLNNADGYAYRYALVNLNPFSITGNDNLYSQHNTGGELNIENFSAQHLQDRAQMLAVKNQLFAEDKLSEFNSPVGDSLYRDIATGLDLRQTSDFSTLDIDRKQTLFGSDESEGNGELRGGNKDDHIYGGKGNDTLNGGKGDDYLEGGTGTDTYIYNTGDGFDTLYDSDGLGEIKWKGQKLNGNVPLSGTNSFIDNTHNIGYQFEPNQTDGDIGILTISDLDDPTSGIHILNYRLGQLGLTLNKNTLVQSDITAFDHLTGNELANLILPSQATQNNNNSIEGLAGDDYLSGRDGDDILKGGTGNDWLYGGVLDKDKNKTAYFTEILFFKLPVAA